jgi:hypothetical protein
MPSAEPPGEVLPLWPGWKRLQGHLEFTSTGDGKQNKQTKNGAFEAVMDISGLEFCFSSKQLCLPCSFLKASGDMPKAANAGMSLVQPTTWLMVLCSRQPEHQGPQHLSFPKRKITLKEVRTLKTYSEQCFNNI